MQVELEPLEQWTTGVSNVDHAVALLLRGVSGASLDLMMPPETAIALGEELARMGRSLLIAPPVTN